MNQETIVKLGELLKDEELVAKMKAGSAEDALTLLKANGLEMTLEEFKAALETIYEFEDGEISEADLEAVAGGISLKKWWRGVKATAKGIWDGFFGN